MAEGGPVDAGTISDLVLADHTGTEVRLGDLWDDRPAVLVLLRHYGWVFCRQHAVQLHRDRDRFEQASARLVLIGHGRRDQAQEFVRKYELEGLTLLVDSERQVYRALGAQQASVGGLFGPGVVASAIRGFVTDRVLQGPVAGNARQLGGVFVIGPDGRIAFSHVARDASDNPSNDEVLAAVRGVVEGQAGGGKFGFPPRGGAVR